MVVVENGEKYLGKNLPVIVTKILQTSAGRDLCQTSSGSLGENELKIYNTLTRKKKF